MKAILFHSADLTSWRAWVRFFIENRLDPESITWSFVPPADLFHRESAPDLPVSGLALRITRETGTLIQDAFLSDDAQRFVMLHRLVWSAHIRVAPPQDLVSKLALLAQAGREKVLRCRHDFVSLAQRGAGNCNIILPPGKMIIAGQAKTMARMIASPWRLYSEQLSVQWDKAKISFGPGLDEIPFRAPRPWIKEGLGYWRGLPTTYLLKNTDPPAPEIMNLEDASAIAADCQRCDLAGAASRTVFGEGAVGAKLMLIGEQPGDQEDLNGRPFVGPAGKLLRDALASLNMPLDDVYITNAVKHFRFTQTPTRRLHQKPEAKHLNACRPWLVIERRIIRPQVIVMMGVTAASSLLQRSVTITRERSLLFALDANTMGLITVHPSYLLRLPNAKAKRQETDRFVADLALAIGALAKNGS